MKKYVFILTLLLIFIFPSVAFSRENTPDGWDSSMFPALPNSQYTNYVMSFYHDSIYGNPYWYLSFLSDDVVPKYRDGKYNIDYYGVGGVVENYRADMVYDSELNQWFVKPFTLAGSYIIDSSGLYGPALEFVDYFNVDILTYSTGAIWREANPFPIPPPVVSELVGGQLTQIIPMIGFNIQTILPIGLIILAIFLVISLVRWLLRSFLLHRQ